MLQYQEAIVRSMGVAHRLEVRCFYLDAGKVLDLNLKTKPPCSTIIPFTPQPHCQMGITVIPIFQMRKLRLKGQRR